MKGENFFWGVALCVSLWFSPYYPSFDAFHAIHPDAHKVIFFLLTEIYFLFFSQQGDGCSACDCLYVVGTRKGRGKDVSDEVSPPSVCTKVFIFSPLLCVCELACAYACIIPPFHAYLDK